MPIMTHSEQARLFDSWAGQQIVLDFGYRQIGAGCLRIIIDSLWKLPQPWAFLSALRVTSCKFTYYLLILTQLQLRLPQETLSSRDNNQYWRFHHLFFPSLFAAMLSILRSVSNTVHTFFCIIPVPSLNFDCCWSFLYILRFRLKSLRISWLTRQAAFAVHQFISWNGPATCFVGY